jgi:hypothetical protein
VQAADDHGDIFASLIFRTLEKNRRENLDGATLGAAIESSVEDSTREYGIKEGKRAPPTLPPWLVELRAGVGYYPAAELVSTSRSSGRLEPDVQGRSPNGTAPLVTFLLRWRLASGLFSSFISQHRRTGSLVASIFTPECHNLGIVFT